MLNSMLNIGWGSFRSFTEVVHWFIGACILVLLMYCSLNGPYRYYGDVIVLREGN